MTSTRPDFTRCFGITHTADGGYPIVREPKLLKVGIGVPRGKGIHVFMTVDGQDRSVWKVVVGTKKDNTKQYVAFTRAEAEEIYEREYRTAPERGHPAKLPYFTFSRMRADGVMEPDFAAIEAHGPMPTELDIVFLSDTPLEASYAMWGAAELRCKGDGINAMRSVNFAQGGEKAVVDELRQSGEKFFPVVNGCATRGCPYTKGEPPPCKPSGDLKFQLANNLRVGGTAYFHTTGYRSISQLFSALHVFRTLTGGGNPDHGRVAGIPFKFVVRAYQTKHNGQVATQYGVSLEFRAETVAALRTSLIEQASQFKFLMAPPAAHAAIAATDEPVELIDEDFGDEAQQAAALDAEFETAPPEPPTVAEKSNEKAEALKQRLRPPKPVAVEAAQEEPKPKPKLAFGAKRETVSSETGKEIF